MTNLVKLFNIKDAPIKCVRHNADIIQDAIIWIGDTCTDGGNWHIDYSELNLNTVLFVEVNVNGALSVITDYNNKQ